MGIEMAIFKV